MDVRISDGDIVVDVNGNYTYISGMEEAVQRVRMILSTFRGSFLYDRSLGVDYDVLSAEQEDPAGRLDMLIKEATADAGGIETEVLSYDPASHIVRVQVTWNGDSAVTEVDISGNI